MIAMKDDTYQGIEMTVRSQIETALRYLQSGRADLAEQALHKLLLIAPDAAVAHFHLGQIVLRRGDVERALGHLGRAVELDPRNSEGRLAWARALMRRGSAKRAAEQLALLVANEPIHPTAWLDLARALHAERRLNEALDAIDTHLQLAASDVGALGLAGRILCESGRQADGRQRFEQAIALSPGQVDAYLAAAQGCVDANEAEVAADYYRRGIEAHPQSVELQLGLAQVLEDLGQRDSAERAYRQALELNPHRGYTIGSLLELLGPKADEELVQRGWQALEGQKATNVAKALVGYGLGKVHQSRKDYERAFRAWRIANDARRQEAGPFDRGAFRLRVDRLIRQFDRDFFARHRGVGSADPRPVFIVGMPRSGTTMIEQVIAAHPLCEGLGELPDIARIAGELQRATSGARGWPESVDELSAAVIAAAANRHVLSLAGRAKTGAERIVDKAPLNFLNLGLIALLFPNARLIWCRRDARDVCLSIYSENFALQQKHATDLSDLAFYFREHERLMRHWQQALPVHVHEVQYENFVTEPAAHAAALISALGLQWDDACLQFHEQQRSVKTPSRWQVRKPFYVSSIGRWKNYEPWLSPLLSALNQN